MKQVFLTDQDINEVRGALDLAVKQVGLGAARAAARIVEALDNAIEIPVIPTDAPEPSTETGT